MDFLWTIIIAAITLAIWGPSFLHLFLAGAVILTALVYLAYLIMPER
jgi:hypothetical protein